MNDRLPDDLRRRFTTAFGLDVSALQFHAASPAAEALGVAAFARGREIHFAPGRFNPTGAPELIAHEISHVVQQAEGRVSPTVESPDGERINDDPALEAEADAAAAKAVRGEPVRPGGAMLAPRAVDIAQAYFRSDAKGHRALSGNGPQCKQVYRYLLVTEDEAAAERFQVMADDKQTDHGLLSKAYDMDQVRDVLAQRVAGSSGGSTAAAKKRRVGKSGERGKKPSGDIGGEPLGEEPKRKQRAKTKPRARRDDDLADFIVDDDDSTSRGRSTSTTTRPRRSVKLPARRTKPRAPKQPTSTDTASAELAALLGTGTSEPEMEVEGEDSSAPVTSLGAWPESKAALEELAPHAPARGDATASWRHYWTALHQDLAQVEGVSSASYEAMLRGITAVMLYKIHIASARSLDVPVKGADVRQEAPQDLDDSNVYYRSQDKGHPVITLYKDLIVMANEGIRLDRKRILAPYNPGVRAFIESATPKDTAAKRSINTTDIQGVLHRQKVKPKKEPASPPPEPVVYGKKHTEMSAGYIGLRQNNADVIEGAVARLLDAPSTFNKFLGYVRGEVGKLGTAPKLPPPLPLVEDHLAAVTAAIADLMASLTVLTVAPTPPGEPAQPTGPETEPKAKPETEPKAKPETEPETEPRTDEESLDRAYLDPSYVVRKLEQAAVRADWIVQNAGALKRLKLARTGQNPQLTVELLKHDDELGDGEHITFVNAVRVYFGALVARHAVASGTPLAIAQRQSFGFLDSSVTDTGEAFRISIGNEPAEMLVAIRDALVALDGELAKAHKAKPSRRRRFAGQTGGKDQPLKTFAKSADAKYLGYWGAISGGQDLSAFLQGAPDISRALSENQNKKRGPLMQQRSAQAALALSKLTRKPAKSPIISGPMQDELAIIEPLQNMLVMAGDALTSCGGWYAGVLPHTRLAGLADLAAAVRRGQRAVDRYAGMLGTSYDSELRALTHRALRNATEDIMDALIVFVATTETFTSSPEDDMTELLRGLYDMPVDVYRTDGGEQAGAVSIAALRKEQVAAGKPFSLHIDTPKAYFEYASFLKQNSIENSPSPEGATATFIDPRPFLTHVGDAFDGVKLMRERIVAIAAELRAPQKSTAQTVRGRAKSTGSPTSSPAGSGPVPDVPPQHTVLLDVTNIDLLSREVTQLIASVRDLIDANKLRVVLINSGVKHEQQGTDRYQVGRIVVIGKAIEEVEDTTDNSLISQFLHMAQRLRIHDATPAVVHERGYEARSLLGMAGRYAALIATYGARDSWATILKTCELASPGPSSESSKVLDVGASKVELDASKADEAARLGLRLVEDALRKLIAALQTATPPKEVYQVFASLPSADQDFVRCMLAPDTDTGTKGGSSTGKTGGGSKSRTRVRAPALSPTGASTASGVSNVGNTCYLSAGLSVLAATDAYYEMFAPVHDEAGGPAELRAAVRGILGDIRAGRAVADEAVEQLLDRLELSQLLPPPSAHDRQFGLTARSAQHDLSEVIFRKLIDRLGAPDAIRTTHIHQSDFTGQQLARTGGDPAQLSTLPQNGVLREQQREVLIELPITQGDTLDAIVTALHQPEAVDGVRVAVQGLAYAGRAMRSEDFEGAPRALAFALKRFDLLEKDERPIDMPAALVWNGYNYSLQAVAYHVGASISGGHYTASTRGADGHWSYRNDSSVTPQSDEHLDAHKNYGTLFTYSRGAAVPLPQPPQLPPPPQHQPPQPLTPPTTQGEHMDIV